MADDSVKFKEEQLKKLIDKNDCLEFALRSIASYVGSGGFNSETVNPEIFEKKIIAGIDNLVEIAYDLGFRRGVGPYE